jgi:hypothetical protein
MTRSHRDKRMIPGSSAVEHSTVNRQVAGSNPARGATLEDKRLLLLTNPGTGAFFPTILATFEIRRIGN